MIDTHTGDLGLKLIVLPHIGGFFDIQDPGIVNGYCAGVTAEYNEKGFEEDHGVSVTFSGRLTLDGYYEPVFGVVTEVEEEEIVARKTAAT